MDPISLVAGRWAPQLATMLARASARYAVRFLGRRLSACLFRRRGLALFQGLVQVAATMCSDLLPVALKLVFPAVQLPGNVTSQGSSQFLASLRVEYGHLVPLLSPGLARRVAGTLSRRLAGAGSWFAKGVYRAEFELVPRPLVAGEQNQDLVRWAAAAPPVLHGPAGGGLRHWLAPHRRGPRRGELAKLALFGTS